MARKAKGKPLTLRPIRLDDDVWAECKKLGKQHGTINEGLREMLLTVSGPLVTSAEIERIQHNVTPRPFKGALLKPKDRK